jgi:anti-sigma B factor antagonist
MSSDTLFTVHIEEADGTLLGTVVGELDLLTEPELVGAFCQALDQTSATASVLDLTRVGFIDSSGLRGLFLCRDQAAAKGIGLSLAVDDGPVTRLFDVAGVRDWFTYT